MNRRRYLTSLAGAGTLGLAGCVGQFLDDSSTPTQQTTLTAAGDAVSVSQPRVRASILKAGVHLDVYAESGTQFLVFEATTEGAPLDELAFALVADGDTVSTGALFVGRSDSKQRATLALPVPVAEYESAAIALLADDESDQWSVPDGTVAALGAVPEFQVESLEVPERVQHGDSFQASFTVENSGDRDARFLAEFGHAQLSDTGEIELTVPAGQHRTHEAHIRPHYDADPEVIPVILDWGVARDRVEVTVEAAHPSTDRPPVNEDLVIESMYAVDGTMVNLGAEGTAKNTADSPLVNCIIEVEGDVDGKRYSAEAKRDRLAPDETWEWSVEFGEEADSAENREVRNLSTVTRGEYAE